MIYVICLMRVCGYVCMTLELVSHLCVSTVIVRHQAEKAEAQISVIYKC